MKRPTPPIKVGRPGIADLPTFPPRFDLALTPEFETARAADGEDHWRAEALRRWARKAMGAQAHALHRLADAIDPSVTPFPTTPASARYTRLQRLNIIGWLWKLVYDTQLAGRTDANHIATFTLVPAGSSVPNGQLDTFDAKRWLQALRQHLLRSQAKLKIAPGGWLFMALHGAYDPVTRTFPVHVHGIAAGDMIRVVDGLRDLRIYQPAAPFDDADRANVPVVMSRQLLTNMPAPLTYILKSYWPRRETILGEDGIRRATTGRVQRIQGSALPEHLLFLHKWRLQDTILMIGMRATHSGLVAR